MTDARTPWTQRLLFSPESAWPIAIARIMIGTVLFAWAVSMMFDMSALLSEDGLVPSELGSRFWRPLELANGRAAWIAVVGLAAVAVPIVVGFRPTWFLIVGFLLLMSLQRRNPMMVNSGDLILRNLVLLLAFTPSGAALSVDRWRRHGRASLRSAPKVAPWGLRLIQLQMMLVYFFAYFSKGGALWKDGSAVSTALRLEDLQRIPDLWSRPEKLHEAIARQLDEDRVQHLLDHLQRMSRNYSEYEKLARGIASAS